MNKQEQIRRLKIAERISSKESFRSHGYNEKLRDAENKFDDALNNLR